MSTRPLHILYVEDSVVSREMVRTILAKQGHSVRCAEDGLAGVRELESNEGCFDVVITDHEMPGLNGLGVVNFLRRNAFEGGVLVHSGSLDAPLIAAYRRLGVQHFLTKPTHASKLVAALDALMADAGDS